MLSVNYVLNKLWLSSLEFFEQIMGCLL